MILVQDSQFIKEQEKRLSHLQNQLAVIVEEMNKIQEFLNEYKSR